MRTCCVDILASGMKGTLSIGVTNDLVRRVAEHKGSMIEGFTKRCRVDRLVHFEEFSDIRGAIEGEKRLKNWKRRWKTELIETQDPSWRDLAKDLS